MVHADYIRLMKYLYLTLIGLTILTGCSSTKISSLKGFENPKENYYYKENVEGQYVSVQTEDDAIIEYFFTNGTDSKKVTVNGTECRTNSIESNCEDSDWDQLMNDADILKEYNKVAEQAGF